MAPDIRLPLLTAVGWVLSISCIHTEKVNNDFLSMLKKPATGLVDKVNLQGGYHTIRKEHLHFPTAYENGKPTIYIDTPYLDNPIFFFQNGLILYHDAIALDSNEFKSWQIKNGAEKWSLNKWGVYTISHDTISAIIYISFFGRSFSRNKLLQCYFQGIIKNRNAIQQWHMIAPYPEDAREFDMNREVFEYLTGPKDLDFKPAPAKLLIDSNKAWILQYKKNDTF